jgi:cytochrome c peroxidase
MASWTANGNTSAFLLLISLAAGPRSFVADNSKTTNSNRPVVGEINSIRMPIGIPEALWKKHVPSDNPVTSARVELGRMLFFDKRLSADGTVSCATCHDPATAFADRQPVAIGIDAKRGSRNAPTLLNAIFNELQFWDGRAHSLEDQVKQPLLNAFEIGMRTEDAVVARVRAIPEYRRQFRQVFTGEVTMKRIAQTIAAFERTLLSANSPFDRFIGGDYSAISEPQRRGWGLFRGKGGCINCHEFQLSSPFFTDFRFHNTGIAERVRNLDSLIKDAEKITALDTQSPRDAKEPSQSSKVKAFAELGRFVVTNQKSDIGAFKTPTLRDVELTAPYMHDGSIKTLLDAIRFYNDGGQANPYQDKKIQPLNLSDEEMNDLVQFLRCLTSDDVLRQVQQSQPQNRTPVPLPSPISH